MSISVQSVADYIAKGGVIEECKPTRGRDEFDSLQDECRHLFEYRDGDLYWKRPPVGYDENGAPVISRDSLIGKRVGSNRNGTRTFAYFGDMRPVARAVWIYHNGTIPKNHDVIHLDGDKMNHSIDNLAIEPTPEGAKRAHGWR